MKIYGIRVPFRGLQGRYQNQVPIQSGEALPAQSHTILEQVLGSIR